MVRALRDAKGVAGVDLLFVHEVSTGKECVDAKIEVPSCSSNLRFNQHGYLNNDGGMLRNWMGHARESVSGEFHSWH